MRNRIPDASFIHIRFNPGTELKIHTHKLSLSSGPGIGLNLLEDNIISGCHYLSIYVPGTILVL